MSQGITPQVRKTGNVLIVVYYAKSMLRSSLSSYRLKQTWLRMNGPTDTGNRGKLLEMSCTQTAMSPQFTGIIDMAAYLNAIMPIKCLCWTTDDDSMDF